VNITERLPIKGAEEDAYIEIIVKTKSLEPSTPGLPIADRNSGL
jgi:hypothetical protein